MPLNIKKTKEEVAQEAVQLIEKSENKSEAIMNAVEMMVSHQTSELVERTLAEAQQASADEEFRKSLNLRTLSSAETTFYNNLKQGARMLTADQIDIIPTTIIDRTLEDVRAKSALLSLVDFAPAGVKKWLVAEKTGAYSWGGLTDAITGKLDAEIKSLDIEVSKLTAYMVIPKAIRDLALPFVDRYFMAVLAETMNDGLEYGFLQGTGDKQPIGIMRKVSENTNSVHTLKPVLTNITGFSPAALKEVRATLSKNGARKVNKLYLVCNPVDAYTYVDPALYGESLGAGYVKKTSIDLEVIECTNCVEGQAIFTIDKKYTMGMSGLQVDEYKETKALDDCDVLIAKAYANGRATDDNTAVVFDVTKLEEYRMPVFVKEVPVVTETEAE